jgi:hypothetical protein
MDVYVRLFCPVLAKALRRADPFSPQANPRDRRLSAKLVPALVDRGCRVVSATDPHGRNLGFLDRSRYFSIQVAPQLSSRG